jgi:uncharacterized protein YndB with AHSA1/START domain
VDWMGVAALLDPRRRGTFRVEVNGRDVVIGEYVEVDPPHRVVFTWGFEGVDPFVEPGSTRVEVTLERECDGTLLTLCRACERRARRPCRGLVALPRAPGPGRRRPHREARSLERQRLRQ